MSNPPFHYPHVIIRSWRNNIR